MYFCSLIAEMVLSLSLSEWISFVLMMLYCIQPAAGSNNKQMIACKRGQHCDVFFVVVSLSITRFTIGFWMLSLNCGNRNVSPPLAIASISFFAHSWLSCYGFSGFNSSFSFFKRKRFDFHSLLYFHLKASPTKKNAFVMSFMLYVFSADDPYRTAKQNVSFKNWQKWNETQNIRKKQNLKRRKYFSQVFTFLSADKWCWWTHERENSMTVMFSSCSCTFAFSC